MLTCHVSAWHILVLLPQMHLGVPGGFLIHVFLTEILFAIFLHHTRLIIPDFMTLIICGKEYKLWKRLLSY